MVDLKFGRSSSRSFPQVPADVAPLRQDFFALVQKLLSPGLAGQTLDLNNLVQQLIQNMLQDPNFGANLLSNATQAITPLTQQILQQQLLPSIAESGLSQGLGTGGSAFAERAGMGAARVNASLLPFALQSLLVPLQFAMEQANFIPQLGLHAATGGAQVPTASRSKSFEFGVSGIT